MKLTKFSLISTVSRFSKNLRITFYLNFKMTWWFFFIVWYWFSPKTVGISFIKLRRKVVWTAINKLPNQMVDFNDIGHFIRIARMVNLLLMEISTLFELRTPIFFVFPIPKCFPMLSIYICFAVAQGHTELLNTFFLRAIKVKLKQLTTLSNLYIHIPRAFDRISLLNRLVESVLQALPQYLFPTLQ